MLSRAFSRASAPLRRVQSQSQRRHMGDWLKTNIRTEENAGLREASYKTWQFDTDTVPRLLMYMFIPGTLFYMYAEREATTKQKQLNSSIVYGIAPPNAEEKEAEETEE